MSLRVLPLLPVLALVLPPLAARANGDNVLPPNAPEAWRKQCTSCHARNGSGQTSLGKMHKAQDFTSTAWQKSRSDAEIRKVIAEGSTRNRMMRGYGKALSDTELDALVKFIRTLDPSRASKGAGTQDAKSAGKKTAAQKSE